MDKIEVAYKIMESAIPNVMSISKGKSEDTMEYHAKKLAEIFNIAYSTLTIKDDPEK